MQEQTLSPATIAGVCFSANQQYLNSVRTSSPLGTDTIQIPTWEAASPNVREQMTQRVVAAQASIRLGGRGHVQSMSAASAAGSGATGLSYGNPVQDAIFNGIIAGCLQQGILGEMSGTTLT